MPGSVKTLSSGRRLPCRFVLPLLMVAALISAAAAAPVDVVKVEMLNSLSAYPQGGAYPLALRLTIAPGYYIYSNRPEKPDYLPTEVRFSPPAGIKMSSLASPQPKEQNSSFSKDKVKVFRGTILVRATLAVAADAVRGPQKIRATLAYQGCSDKACLLPQEKTFDFQIKVAPAGKPGQRLNKEFFGEK